MNTLKLERLLIWLALVFGVVLFSGSVFGQPTPTPTPTPGASTDAIQMLTNLSNSYPALFQLITGACVVMGFILALSGVYYLRAYGELRTMMSSQTSMRTPVTLFITAAVFMYLPSAWHTLLTTSFGYSSPLAYDSVATSVDPVIMKSLVGLVQLIGLIAFIRGWMILVAHAKQPGGHATVGKALTHIIGGLFAINILGFMEVIWNTFGFHFG